MPVGFKDYWNSQYPRNDSQFNGGALKPELAGLINLLYPATADVDTTGRTDLQLVLHQGLPGFNSTGTRIMDMLRLNTGIPPCTADSAIDDTGDCRKLGAFYEDEADLAGFPNGRRLGDDVTDIELRAVAQGYGAQLGNPVRRAEQVTEQHDHRRRERERRGIPQHVPVPRAAVAGLREPPARDLIVA